MYIFFLILRVIYVHCKKLKSIETIRKEKKMTCNLTTTVATINIAYVFYFTWSQIIL